LPSRATKKIKDEDLKKAVQSKAGGPLSRALVHDDVISIIELYRLHGYFGVEVDPKTIAGKDGRENLVFEIKEGDKLAVRRVAFAGNSAYPSNKLKGVVKSGETNVLSFLLNNDIYDADRIDTDRDLLRRFYRAHGYADVRVRSAASYEADKKGVAVTFTIDEGPQYRFGQVDIVSNVKSVDPAALRSSLRTQAGEIYDAGAVDKTVEELALALAKSGSPFAAALPRSERLPDQRLINLVYTIVGDKRVYVERIDIHGNIKTRDEVIRREFDLVEGDDYNRALIERGERRLKQLGYFKTVKISEKPGSAPDRVVVDVALEEDKTAIFSVMGGYSGTDGLSATVTVGDANFLGTGDIAKASATVGQIHQRPIADRSQRARSACFARRRSVRQGDIRQQLSVVQLDLLRRQDRHRRAVDRAAWHELELLDLQSEPHASVGRHRLAADPADRGRRPDVGVLGRHRHDLFDARQSEEPDWAACACKQTTSLPGSGARPSSPGPRKTHATITRFSAT
jgi:outer membrane protein insertion porin family